MFGGNLVSRNTLEGGGAGGEGEGGEVGGGVGEGEGMGGGEGGEVGLREFGAMVGKLVLGFLRLILEKLPSPLLRDAGAKLRSIWGSVDGL